MDGLELQRYLLNREVDFWLEEGRDRTGDRILDMTTGSPEEQRETAWQDYCYERYNEAAWKLEELESRIEGRPSRHPDAKVVNIEDWRNSKDSGNSE